MPANCQSNPTGPMKAAPVSFVVDFVDFKSAGLIVAQQEISFAGHATEIADARAANVRPFIKEIQASGVRSMRGIARALTARGVKAARGGDWSDVQVAGDPAALGGLAGTATVLPGAAPLDVGGLGADNRDSSPHR